MKGVLMTYKTGSIYEVEWIDHFSTEKEPPASALKQDPVLIKSYGVYIGETAEYIVLGQSVDLEGGKNSDNLHLLKVGVRKVRELR
jgi:hypothetical protein